MHERIERGQHGHVDRNPKRHAGTEPAAAAFACRDRLRRRCQPRSGPHPIPRARHPRVKGRTPSGDRQARRQSRRAAGGFSPSARADPRARRRDERKRRIAAVMRPMRTRPPRRPRVRRRPPCAGCCRSRCGRAGDARSAARSRRRVSRVFTRRAAEPAVPALVGGVQIVHQLASDPAIAAADDARDPPCATGAKSERAGLHARATGCQASACSGAATPRASALPEARAGPATRDA